MPLRFAAERLIDLALDARRYETELFDGLLGQLAAARAPSWVAAGSGASSGEQSWPRIVSRELWSSLQRAARYGWQQGWQPAEAVRQVDRRFGARHARLAVDAVAGEMRSYAAPAVDERWQAQLTALRATAWWDPDDQYLEQWQARECLDWRATVTCVLETMLVLTGLPQLAVLCPLPGTARNSAPRGHTPGAAAAAGSEDRHVDKRMLDRVRGLLAKAESTEFPEEAEALTTRAQELMARHSIDEALLAAAAERVGRARSDQPTGRRFFVDNPYEAPKAHLVEVIATANRCRAIWHKNLGLSSVVGFPADLDAVELLYTSLLVQAIAAMVAAGSRKDQWGRSRTRSFRQSFLAAYAQRIGERLAGAISVAEYDAAAAESDGNLLPVLAARHRVVDDAFAEMFPDMEVRATAPINDREGWYSGLAAAGLATLHGRREVAGDAA